MKEQIAFTSVRSIFAATVVAMELCCCSGMTDAATLTLNFDSPIYTVGDLVTVDAFIGQDNWANPFAGSTTPQVSDTQVISGNQSMVESGDNFFALHKIGGIGWNNGTTLSILVQPNDVDSTSTTIVPGLYTPGGVIANTASEARMVFNSGSIGVNDGTTLNTLGSYTPGHVYKVTYTFTDFTAGKYAASVFDVTTSSLVNSVSGLSYYAPGITAAQMEADGTVGLIHFGAGNAVFDNIVVTAVPEPSSIMMLMMGGLGLVVWRRLKK